MSHGREALGELLITPVQVRPVRQIMDIPHNHRNFRGEYSRYSPQRARIITARSAAISGPNHRTRHAEPIAGGAARERTRMRDATGGRSFAMVRQTPGMQPSRYPGQLKEVWDEHME